jgi:CTP:molybdopterin cytidylyltransferase MocA
VEYICLAAGQGTRFGRLGSYLQKCMYPILLRPFLEHTLAQWHVGAQPDPTRDRLTLVVGHHAAQVRAYFGASHHGVPLRYVEQEAPRGTGDALGLAAEALIGEEPGVAWLADLFVGAAAFAALRAHRDAAVVTLAPGDGDEDARLRVRREGPRVTRVWDGDEARYDVGLWKLPLPVMRDLRRVRADKGEYRVLPNLQTHVDAGLPVGWIEIDEWVHLGGTVPTPDANLRRVIERVLAAAS